MRKIALLALSFFLISFLFKAPVLAEYPAGDEHGGVRLRLEEMRLKREEFREKKREIRAQVKTNRGTATASAHLREKTVEKIKAVFTKILSRFEAALSRLDKIANRIATRIDKLNEKGVNTSAAQAALLNAEKSGADARLAMDKAKSDISAIDTSSSTVKDAVRQATSSMKAVKSSLQAYHKALVAALRELKAKDKVKEGSQSAK